VTGDLRPYRLRGSFVSLVLWEGRSLASVAEQAGHSIATRAKHYAGVIRELETSRASRARKRFARPASRCGVPQMCERPNWHPRDITENWLQIREWTMLGSNQRPPPCRDGTTRLADAILGQGKHEYAGRLRRAVWHPMALSYGG
jgi:hypothetical protein